MAEGKTYALLFPALYGSNGERPADLFDSPSLAAAIVHRVLGTADWLPWEPSSIPSLLLPVLDQGGSGK